MTVPYNRLKLVVLDRLSAESIAWLQAHAEYDVIALTHLKTFDELETQAEESGLDLKTVGGLIARSKFRLDENTLSALPSLQAAVTATVGFDHLDLAACRARAIKLAYCPDSHSASAAELTWALLLACAKKLKAADAVARSQDWNREPLMGWQLEGKTHGVMGLGRIGTRVAKMARAFGMRVVAHDPYRDNAWFEKHQAERVGVDELFHLSDSVSIHTPLTRETKGRINRIHLDMLRSDSIIVNTARGGILREDDLLLHLKKKGPGTFGLDVFQNEPLKQGSDFLLYPQVVLTPHIGATTLEAFKAVSMEAAKNLVGLLRNEAVSGPLPPQEEWYLAVSQLAGTTPF